MKMIVSWQIDARFNSDDHSWSQLSVALHQHCVVCVQPQIVPNMVGE